MDISDIIVKLLIIQQILISKYQLIYLDYDKLFSYKNDWNNTKTNPMISYVIKHIFYKNKKQLSNQNSLSIKYKATLSKFWYIKKPFLIDSFKTTFKTRNIFENIILHQNASKYFWYIFFMIDISASKVLPNLYNTTYC